MRQCVFGLVNHLPESLRSVIILADVEEFTHREIAEVTGITVGNLKIRLHRARKKLKLLLELGRLQCLSPNLTLFGLVLGNGSPGVNRPK